MKFTEEHLWLREEDGMIVVGVTEFGVAELGEIAFVELPEEGDTVVKDDECAVVESDKTTSDILAPIGGEIADVNTALTKNPGLLADDPVGDGWLFAITPEDMDEMDDLMDEGAYKKYVG
ncbi:glycine cleavage system H protein [Loktanella atrilutea]|uniref:Glycine cleavage system H protein n=1 Tax=Loktanella atrilutea TaxID=366533 RepID=A0A1M4X1G9_LOKAT|nr:glycine cleavage system protein GcvH [Loktanella atrilutea]SHE87300.1 glycine cleavage system H protein [Loktanella atrilutea]